MKLWKRATACTLLAGTMTGAALACGSPPTPPPPPPPPPIVCCQVVQHFVDPTDPNFECIIIRYFRRDGLPLYQSNPMPLAPSQFCLCSLPGLPALAIQKGAKIVRTVFGSCGPPRCPILPWQDLPPDVPPYGPFEPDPVPDPGLKQQIQFFYNQFLALAQGPDVDGQPQDIRPPEGGDPCQVFGFSPSTVPPPICRCDLNGDGVIDQGDVDLYQQLLATGNAPDCNGDGVVNGADLQFLIAAIGTTCRPAGGGIGITIPPNVFWDIYQKIRVPRGFDVDCLCVPNQIWILGLFFFDAATGEVQLEPGVPGPGIPGPVYNPGQGDPGAIYKFRWYRPLLPPPCPPPCFGDSDFNRRRNFDDIIATLSVPWGPTCPP